MVYRFPLMIIMITFTLWNNAICSTDSGLALMDHISNWNNGHSKLSIHCRPTLLPDNRTKLSYSNTLVQLVDLDVKSQLLTGMFWEYHKWIDPRLVWDPADYDNITSVNIPPHSDALWMPDIVLYNQYDMKRQSQYQIRVYYNGTIIWIPASVYQVACSMDITYFPWDTHHCRLVFGSWALTEDELVLVVDVDENVNPSQIIPSSEWLVEESPPVISSTPFGSVGTWSLITYSFTFRRRVAFFTYVVAAPPIVMSFLTILVFCLPPDMVDKINIALTLFLSYFVLLMIVVESTPRSGFSIPLLGQYLFVCMSLLAASIFASAFVYNLATNDTRRPFSPATMRCLTVVGKLVGITPPRRTNKTETIQINEKLHGSLENSLMSPRPHVEITNDTPGEPHFLGLVLQRVLFILYMVVNTATLIVLIVRFAVREE